MPARTPSRVADRHRRGPGLGELRRPDAAAELSEAGGGQRGAVPSQAEIRPGDEVEPDHLSQPWRLRSFEPEPDRSECERLLGKVLREAVHRLPSGLQQTLYWRLKKRRPVREVGKLLGIHYARVSARMTEAEERLKVYMSAAGNRPGDEGASIRACQETEFQGLTFAALAARLLEILEELQGRGEES
jgi:DNA-directed RNA polymerase specialized sigma24 family protein